MKGKRLFAATAACLALVAVLAASAAATGFFSHHHRSHKERAFSHALHDRDPKNVIFLLGDGMGTQEITAARYYQGVYNPLNVDRMPFTGFDTT
jgi:alkaline phosphatase